MSDEQETGVDSLVETAADAVGDLISGVPAPVKKNAWKAFTQLCTAAVDIPVAHLEGKAAEKRAETAARVKLIETGAEKIARQMEVAPEYAQAAVEKYGQRIIREQVNVDKIVAVAKDQLEQLPPPQQAPVEPPPISEDWLNSFEKEAGLKSSEDMQQLYGKILAGEIQHPSSFSIRAVKLMGELDTETARLFQILCSHSIALWLPGHIIDVRVPGLQGSPGGNSLRAFGLGFSELNRLNEHGLIISDYNSYMGYEMCIAQRTGDSMSISAPLPFTYRKQKYAFQSLEENPTQRKEFRVKGVALSTVGKELFPIVDVLPNDNAFTANFEAFLKTHKLSLVAVSN